MPNTPRRPKYSVRNCGNKAKIEEKVLEKPEKKEKNVVARPKRESKPSTSTISTPTSLKYKMAKSRISIPGCEPKIRQGICWIASDDESVEDEAENKGKIQEDGEDYMGNLLNGQFPYRLSPRKNKETDAKKMPEVGSGRKEMSPEEPAHANGNMNHALEDPQEEARDRQLDRTFRPRQERDQAGLVRSRHAMSNGLANGEDSNGPASRSTKNSPDHNKDLEAHSDGQMSDPYVDLWTDPEPSESSSAAEDSDDEYAPPRAQKRRNRKSYQDVLKEVRKEVPEEYKIFRKEKGTTLSISRKDAKEKGKSKEVDPPTRSIHVPEMDDSGSRDRRRNQSRSQANMLMPKENGTVPRKAMPNYKFYKPINVKAQFNPFQTHSERHEYLMKDLKKRQIRVDEERAAKEAARRAAREAETIANGKTPRRKLPPSGAHLLDPNKNYKLKKYVEIKRSDPRPVIYRLKALTVQEIRNQKRTRVTRQIAHAKIPQFHLEHHELTTYRNVGEQSLHETVEAHLEASKPFIPKSDKYFDEYVATALEYDNSVKMLHFGFTLKKHSCKQKRLKFQTTWWQRKREAFQKPKSGLFPRPASPVYKCSDDPALYAKHFLLSPYEQSPIEKIIDLLRKRITKRRTDNDVIADSTYFVREFFLTKCSISFRIERSSDIPDVFVPPTLNAGYFPFSATTDKAKMHYLACRYIEAQQEYLSLTYRDMTPPHGYILGSITQEELFEFHMMGRHIHGFFVVWESTHEIHSNKNERYEYKRYLVDMFCHQMFPIDIEYERWDRQLKLAFDKTVAYNLNFAESIRVNRPVYDKLAQNKSMFNKITLKEMGNYMKEAEINSKYLLRSVGNYEFYMKGLYSTNLQYLSAFFIIVGASKNLKSIDKYDLGKDFVYANDPLAPGMLTKDGQMYEIDSGVVPTKILLASENYSNAKAIEEIEFVYPLSRDAANTTRIVRNLPILAPKTQPAPKKRRRECVPIDEYELLTRKKLIKVRSRMYKYSMPKTPKKKPEQKVKQKPGRKPETPLGRGLKKHDFAVVHISSDAESEYEGYLSQDEGHGDTCPKLKRTTSLDSIFLEPTYKEYRFDKLSWFHQQQLLRPKQKLLQKRKRKMNRIRLKNTLRYGMLHKEAEAFKEMTECYHGNLPRTNKEIANTKNCIRNPHKFDKLNIPKVYSVGDAPFVDTVASILKAAVTHTVALEHAGIRFGNNLSRDLQRSRVDRNELLIDLPVKTNAYLPPPKFLAMELLSMERMTSFNAVKHYTKEIRKDLDRKVGNFLMMPRYEQEYEMRIQKLRQDKKDFEDYWRHQRQREVQFDKSLKIVHFDARSLQAQQKKEAERKLARRHHSARALAFSKLSPDEQEQVRREERARKEERERERRRSQKMAKEQRAVLAAMAKIPKQKTELEKREELAREWHREKMLDAELEILELRTEGRNRWLAWQKKRKEAEKMKKEKERKKNEEERNKNEEEKKKNEEEKKKNEEERRKNEEERRKNEEEKAKKRRKLKRGHC